MVAHTPQPDNSSSPPARSSYRKKSGKKKPLSKDGHRDKRPDVAAEAVRVPVVREQLKVGKKKRRTGRVTVRVVPQVRTETLEVPLEQEQVQIERVPINRVVEKPFPQRQEGDATVVPVFEEVLVVEKKLMLKEEVRITRRRTTYSRRQDIALRTEQVRITRTER